MDLVAFLNARLDEDEARVKRGQPVPWTTEMTARAYRDVEAKRRILKHIVPELDVHDSMCFGEYNHPADWNGNDLMKLMAAVYSDHMDYDPAWA